MTGSAVSGRSKWMLGALAGVSLLACAGIGFAASGNADASVALRLKTRLPKTQISKVDCVKAPGLCEVTAGNNLFYVDPTGRYLVIGRLYDMETRQDLTAARLLEINPDMLLGGSANAQARADREGEGARPPLSLAEGVPHAVPGRASGQGMPRTSDRHVALAGLPRDGAIIWGNSSGPTVTVFSDFRCSYCRALSQALEGMNVRVVERPISVLGSRDLSDRVYCARDQHRALRAAYAGGDVAPGNCDTSGLDANEKFARANGFSGTPVIVRSDGAVIEGYRPREFLLAWLKGAQS